MVFAPTTSVLLATAIAAFAVIAASTASAGADGYSAWLEERNITVSESIAAVGPDSECVALSDVAAGSRLLHVPPESVVTTSLVLNSYVNRTLVALNLQLPPQIVLALFLVEAKHNASSPFAAYAQQLPSEFGTSIFFSDEELLELQGSALLVSTLQRKALLELDFNTIEEALKNVPAEDNVFPEGALTLESFTWALSVVWSRGVLLSFEESRFAVLVASRTQPVLVPVIERFAVSNYASASVGFDQETGGLYVAAADNITEGDAVVITMGRKSNVALLLNYGRMDDRNPFDYVTIGIRMAAKSAFTDLKEKMLNQLGLSMNDTYYLRNEDTGLSQNLLRMMRVQMMRPSEFDKFESVLLKAQEEQPREKQIVSLRNEHATLKTVVAACDQLLSTYNTTLQEDETILRELLSQEEEKAKEDEQEQEEARARVRKTQIVTLRMSEKRILLTAKARAMQLWLDLMNVETAAVE